MAADRNETVRLNFTRERIRSLKPPAKGRQYVRDTKVPGLTLCLTAAGGRTWYVYRWAAGRPQRVRLGRADEITLAEARRLAGEVGLEVAAGADPAAERRKRRRAGITLADAWNVYFDRAKARNRSWRESKRIYERHLAGWAGRRLDAITPAMVEKLLDGIGADRPYMANRIRALLSALFGKRGARQLGYRGDNPAAEVERFPEQKRDRFIGADEMPAFMAAIARCPSREMRDFFMLALLTGARRANLAAARWEHISFDRRTWTIPAADAKAGKPITIPLTAAALAVLHQRRLAVAEGCAWLFPSSRSASGHVEEPKKAWAALLADAGLEGIRIHDLRRTCGSWLAAGGASLPMIGRLLGHSSPTTTAIYSRLDVEPVRRALAAATEGILAAGNGEGYSADAADSGRRGAVDSAADVK